VTALTHETYEIETDSDEPFACSVCNKVEHVLFECDRWRRTKTAETACRKLNCAMHSMTINPRNPKAEANLANVSHICAAHLLAP